MVNKQTDGALQIPNSISEEANKQKESAFTGKPA